MSSMFIKVADESYSEGIGVGEGIFIINNKIPIF